MATASEVLSNLHETVKMHIQQKGATSNFEVNRVDTVNTKVANTSNYANR
jgi:hypothetical protein